ncbi:MAG: PDZ domain-containing protein [Bacteroidales bacterium]|nr:PDZ domain-containing protein [Bacteroidales bacterium]
MKTKNIIFGILSGMLGGVIILFGFILFSKPIAKPENENHFLVNEYEGLVNSNQIYKTSASSFNLSEFTNFPLDFTYAAEQAVNAVVHVQTQHNAPNYTIYDYIFGTTPRYSTPVMNSGSGVIISSDGYIVTNAHVIANAEIIKIILNDKRMYEAKLIGKDEICDIALIKIDETSLSFIPYADSEQIKIGEWVLAVGNPFNLTSTVTAGIISAKARNISIMEKDRSIESFIQTDAAINPGNSGGALVNTNGELIGINSAIASRTGSFVGYSFAIPSNIVRKTVADFIEFGDVQRAFLGIEVSEIDDAIAKKLNMKKPIGILVTNVWGDKSTNHLKTGDIIIEVNAHKINSGAELNEQLSKHRPGDKVKITYLQNGKTVKKEITLKNKYGSTEIIQVQTVETLGAWFEPVPESEKYKLRINNGIKVKQLKAGILLAKGMKEGFIITKINNLNINSVSDIEKALKLADGAVFIEGIYPNGAMAYFAFGI